MNDLNETIFECEDGDDATVAKRDDDSSESDSGGIVLNFDRNRNSFKKKGGKRQRKNSAPNVETNHSRAEEEEAISFRPLSKVPTVATDQEVEQLMESCQKKSHFQSGISPRKARALRRRLYLDLYKEVANKMLI